MIVVIFESNMEYILKVNEVDLKNGKEKGFDEVLMDCFVFLVECVKEFVNGFCEVVELDDLIGDILLSWILDNGLDVK